MPNAALNLETKEVMVVVAHNYSTRWELQEPETALTHTHRKARDDESMIHQLTIQSLGIEIVINFTLLRHLSRIVIKQIGWGGQSLNRAYFVVVAVVIEKKQQL